MCRGSLAWNGRQTHNLESVAKRPEVAGSNPAPGTKKTLMEIMLDFMGLYLPEGLNTRVYVLYEKHV